MMVVGQIILWLLIGIAIGFVIAWILRKQVFDKTLASELESAKASEETRRERAVAELKEWKGKAAGLSTDLETRRAELELRAADLERANTQIAERKSSFAKLEADLKTYRSANNKLGNQVADRESTIASLREKASGAVPAADVQRQLDGANGTIGALRKDTEGYQATITSLRDDLGLAKRDKTNLAEQVETSDGKLATVASALEASRDNTKTLQARLADLESVTTKTGNQQHELAELSAKLAAANARVREVEASHADCEERIATTSAKPAAPEPDLESESLPATPEVETKAVEQLPERDTAVAMVAKIATRTRGSGPAVDDDLKKIHGVGPKLEGLLKSMDITSFRQVAAFTAEDIQYVTAALDAFPGRIERDDWMSSAAEEHAKKYDEAS